MSQLEPRDALCCDACESEDTRAVTVDGALTCAQCGERAQGIRTCLQCGVTRLSLYDPEDPETDGEDEDCAWCEPDLDAFDRAARSYRYKYGDGYG